MVFVIFLLGFIGYSAYANNIDKDGLEISQNIAQVVETQKLIEGHREKDIEYDFISDRLTFTNLVDQFIKKNEHFFEVQEEDDKTFSQDFLKLFLVCACSTLAYGIIHDQITARMCIEYFNSNAVPENRHRLDNLSFLSRNSPIAVGLVMALCETFLPAILIGAAVSSAARVGSTPKLKLRDLSMQIAGLFGIVAISSCGAGLIGCLIGEVFFGAILSQNRQRHVPQAKNGLFGNVDPL